MAAGRKTGGRVAGVPNKASIERQAKIEASGLTPLDYLLSVMRDDRNDADARRDAAKAAAPYVHPKLSSVEMRANVSVAHEDVLDGLE